MAEQNPPAQPAAGSGAAPKPSTQNPAFRMMGLPALPRKLPSRNWMIFWAITGSFTAAIIYDKREKNRATAKWRRAVAPLAKENIADASQMPRKLTIYIEAPPGDGLRVTQDHFIEYVKPVLSASGLDWEFVQGRQQGDVRAVVAEKIRRQRSAHEQPDKELPPTDESIVEGLRKKSNIPGHEGVKGDIIIGRHAWKEYIRGLHEGWLGPLDPPPESIPEVKPVEPSQEEPKPDAEKPEEEKKPERPPQPRPYNSVEDYASATLPSQTPLDLPPAAIIPFPHRLGFTHTFVRLGWFLNRRKLADNIGREVAAACFAASREWREADGVFEQELALQHEEKDWPKNVWTDEPDPPKEKIWVSPMVADARIARSMRRFEVLPEHEAAAAAIAVPEEEIEGWIKGSLRSLWRWGVKSFEPKHLGPNVGNLDDE
ncbi:mitochondrial import inner membrane translocase subunit Tim54 [Stachybotrys elegans]|uniref:Mitochondrial import inner membrane translocase subunit TIM54 n=1 Tax=Stachybotrys elegans TaxID=80388 RepID=A0A8K0WVD7_9HYPO|nr:mitochondrial import inner membrane translocase subunit Tim54 [Stachybotrys elegans]